MTEQEFVVKVKELEKLSKKNPKKYKIKVFMYALLGYLYVFGVLLLSILIIGLLIYLAFVYNVRTLVNRIGIPLIILVFIIIKSLFVKFDKPKGIILNRNEAKELYEMTDELAKKLKTKKIHEIVLTEELNAALYQYPRLGIFGFYKNYLIIGLPLMGILTNDELKSIIAHELGHLSGNHSKFSAYIYRIRATWDNLMTNLQKSERKTTVIFEGFLKWYIPIFNAYNFVLIREQEYQADSLAVQLTNKDIFSQSLLKLNVVSMYNHNDFNYDVYKLTREINIPINNFYNKMITSFTENINENIISSYINESLKYETNCVDTHPSLKDRLAFVNASSNQNIYFENNALNLLGDSLNKYFNIFNSNWQNLVSNWWNENHNRFNKMKSKLDVLEKKADVNDEELLEKANIYEELDNIDEAFPIYEKLALESELTNAKFSYGRLLLGKQNTSGIDFIEEAIKKDIRYTTEGCRLIHNYLIDINKEEAQKYYERAKEYNEVYELAKKERDHIGLSEKYLYHDVDDKTIENVVIYVKNYQNVKEAYLVKKDVQYLKEFPLYILAVKFKDIDLETQQKFVNKMAKEISFPGETFVINLKRNEKFEEIVNNIENCLIFKE